MFSVPTIKSTTVFLALACVLALTACARPEKPEGVDQEGFGRIGDRLQARGDIAGAVNFYQRSLQQNPRDVDTRLHLLTILENQGEKDTAKVGYEEGLKYDSDNLNLLRGYGKLLLRMGQADTARSVYQKLLSHDDSDLKALNGLGVALDMLGQHDEAQKYYLKALDQSSDDVATLSNLGHSYVLAGKISEAIKLLEPVALQPKASPALRQNLAEAYALSGMDVDAERVGLKDLSVKDVKRNAEIYKSKRVALALVPKLAVNLGSFPTEPVATAHLESVKKEYAAALEGLTLAVTPEISVSGGTPKFVLYAQGFKDKAARDALCVTFKKNGLPCAVAEK